MNRRSDLVKRVMIALGAAILLIGLLAPAFAFAQSEEAQVCDRLDSFASQGAERIAQRTEKLAEVRQQRRDRLKERQQTLEDKLEANRERWDKNRTEHFDKLRLRATTQEQSQAVAAFVETIQTAIAERREAIDKAHQEFRDGLAELLDESESDRDENIAAFQGQVQTAVEQAKSDCESGSPPGQVRSALQRALRQAKQELEDDRPDIEIRELAQARQDKVRQAVQEFQATVKTAADQLSEALGVRG